MIKDIFPPHANYATPLATRCAVTKLALVVLNDDFVHLSNVHLIFVPYSADSLQLYLHISSQTVSGKNATFCYKLSFYV
jgi:hypothetical protein